MFCNETGTSLYYIITYETFGRKTENNSRMFVKNMIVPWIEENFQFVEQLSRIDVQKKPRKKNKCVWEERIIKIF